MNKFLKLFLSSLLVFGLILSSTSLSEAKTHNKVTSKVNEINDKYNLDVEVTKSGDSESILKELDQLEQELLLLDTIKKNNNTVTVEVNPNNKQMNFMTRAADIGFHKWTELVIINSELGQELRYTKEVTFNYQYEYRDGAYRFVSVFDVNSTVKSMTDILVAAGLKGWNQDSWTASFHDDAKTVKIEVKGHYKLGLNYDFISIGVPIPFSNETWNLDLKFAGN